MLTKYKPYKDQLSNDIPLSTTQRVYRELRQKIISGNISPGERLKVEELKSTLNTGATPIREALSLLTSDQLVERIDQRGFRAAPANKENFEEIFNLRCQLESMALRTSIEKGPAQWEEDLLLANHRLSKASIIGSDLFEQHHKMFHMTLLSACGSSLLMGYCNQLYDLNIRYRHLAEKTEDYGARNVKGEHDDILQAAINRDADLACSVLLKHYERTGQIMINRIST